MGVGIEIAMEIRIGQRASDGNFATRVGGDGLDLFLESGLREQRTGNDEEDGYETHLRSLTTALLWTYLLTGRLSAATKTLAD